MTTSPEYRQRLVIMVKEPRPGKVKTRLGAGIGMTASAWWFRHQSAGLIRRLRDARWQVIIAVTPDTAGMQSRVWPGDLARWPQGSGDIGDRMIAIFDGMPKGPVVIIGADIPGIKKAHIIRAFRSLGQSDVVFGPATDGGFWLVGMKRLRPRPLKMFADVRWSTENALADSLSTVSGCKIAMIDELSDVDTADDI